MDSTSAQFWLQHGLYGSGPGHWQRGWQRAEPDWGWVVQPEPAVPDLLRWSAHLRRSLLAGRDPNRPQVLVAHSFGALTALHCALQEPGLIDALFLVAPADPHKFVCQQHLRQAAPCPTLVVASRNDRWLAFPLAQQWAEVWHAQLHDAGAVGHINAESVPEDWPEGRTLLQTLLQRSALLTS